MAACVVRVVESPDLASDAGRDVCALGVHASIDRRRLAQFLSRRLEPVDADLLNLLAAVRYIDRLATRHLAGPWGREFEVLMPVAEPSHWRASSVSTSLSRCLSCLTGDRWTFVFRAREKEDPLLVQGDLFAHQRRGGVVVPYSGGLDSYAALELHLAAASMDAAPPILLTARVSAHVESLLQKTAGASDCHRLVMPINARPVKHGEASGRIRTFVFFTLACIAARMADAEAVLVPENGQGTLGPVVVPFGREHPLMTSHPRFTRLLREFLTALWGTPAPVFRHPWVFTTKGEMLTRLQASGRGTGWRESHSCGRPTARAKGIGAPGHCGVCANCILRRQSLHASDWSPFAQPVEPYAWSDLGKEEMDESLEPSLRRTSLRDRGYAVHGIRDHQTLAELDVVNPSSATLRRVEDIAWGLSTAQPIAMEGLRRLVRAHAREWSNCLASLPDRSWFRHAAVGGSHVPN